MNYKNKILLKFKKSNLTRQEKNISCIKCGSSNDFDFIYRL